MKLCNLRNLSRIEKERKKKKERKKERMKETRKNTLIRLS